MGSAVSTSTVAASSGSSATIYEQTDQLMHTDQGSYLAARSALLSAVLGIGCISIWQDRCLQSTRKVPFHTTCTSPQGWLLQALVESEQPCHCSAVPLGLQRSLFPQTGLLQGTRASHLHEQMIRNMMETAMATSQHLVHHHHQHVCSCDGPIDLQPSY